MPSPWPSDRHLLVVDDERASRDAVVLMLSTFECACHAACSYEDALELFLCDPKIAVVLVDNVGSRVDTFVECLRAAREDVIVIGNSGADRRDAFAAAGVSRFLHKPWQYEQLVSLVEDRIRSCVGCGLCLPLRRPRVDEVGMSWVCAYCGHRYHALRDEDAPEIILLNARLGD